jgi:hypothetical protein
MAEAEILTKMLSLAALHNASSLSNGLDKPQNLRREGATANSSGRSLPLRSLLPRPRLPQFAPIKRPFRGAQGLPSQAAAAPPLEARR